MNMDPMEGIPVEAHAAMEPYLKLSRSYAQKNAEQIFTYSPPPWSDETGSWIVGTVVNEFRNSILSELSELPEPIHTAMARQVCVTFLDRVGELFHASGSSPQGGSA